jgi:glycosyltransferase involved in cell wall biosynthesis
MWQSSGTSVPRSGVRHNVSFCYELHKVCQESGRVWFLRPVGDSTGAAALRVLHCIASLGGGGAERQLAYLAAELRKRGVDVHIVFHQRGPNHSRISTLGVSLHELRSFSNYDPLLLWQLIRTIRTVKPDVIQTWLPQMDVLGGVAAFWTRTPVVLTERSTAQNYAVRWKEACRFWAGRRAALVVANSQSGKEYWLPQKPSHLIKVIHNAIPVEEITRVSPVYCDQEATELVLFAGRYSPEKNVSVLLDAILQVLSERPCTTAVFFGEGPLRSELLAKVKISGMEDRMEIREYTTELWNWVKRASLFVSVSLFEGCPNTVIEAALLRCPLVLSDISQHREFFGNESACFVSPKSPDSITRGIVEVLGDPERTRLRAESAYRTISGFNIQSITNDYISLYSGITKHASSMKKDVRTIETNGASRERLTF